MSQPADKKRINQRHGRSAQDLISVHIISKELQQRYWRSQQVGAFMQMYLANKMLKCFCDCLWFQKKPSLETIKSLHNCILEHSHDLASGTLFLQCAFYLDGSMGGSAVCRDSCVLGLTGADSGSDAAVLPPCDRLAVRGSLLSRKQQRKLAHFIHHMIRCNSQRVAAFATGRSPVRKRWGGGR